MSCCKNLKPNFSNNKHSCFQDNITSCKDEGKTFSFNFKKSTSKSICKIDIRCLLKNEATKQCDFIFKRCLKNNVEWYIIEMKGSAHDEAFQQIKSSIRYFKEKGIIQNTDVVYAYIVSKRTPKIDGYTKKLKEKFLQEKIGISLQKVNPGTQLTFS